MHRRDFCKLRFAPCRRRMTLHTMRHVGPGTALDGIANSVAFATPAASGSRFRLVQNTAYKSPPVIGASYTYFHVFRRAPASCK